MELTNGMLDRKTLRLLKKLNKSDLSFSDLGKDPCFHTLKSLGFAKAYDTKHQKPGWKPEYDTVKITEPGKHYLNLSRNSDRQFWIGMAVSFVSGILVTVLAELIVKLLGK